MNSCLENFELVAANPTKSAKILNLLSACFSDPEVIKINGLDMIAQMDMTDHGPTLTAMVKGFEIGVQTRIEPEFLEKSYACLKTLFIELVEAQLDHYHDSLSILPR